MTEKIILLENIEPQVFYGSNNQNLAYLKNQFPKLQIIARGEDLKLIGDTAEIQNFYGRFEKLEQHYLKKQDFSEAVLRQFFSSDSAKESGLVPSTLPESESDILVHGTRSQPVRPRTPNQKEMVKAIEINDVLFALGPAGSGKTYTAVALAVRALKNKQVKKIILTRPAVEAGESLGFLPGDLKEKIDPYLRPLYDALEDMIPIDRLKSMIESNTIEIAPMAFMRGRTLDNCFIILDEAQNSTETQLKMFLTRMGPTSKVIITGDLSQIDLPKNQPSGLPRAVDLLKDIKGISIVRLKVEDVVRHRLVKEIIMAYNME